MDKIRIDRDVRPPDTDGKRVGRVGGGRKPVELFPVGATFGQLTCVGWERHADATGKKGYVPRMRCACGWEGLMARNNFYGRPAKSCNACRLRAAQPPTVYGPRKAFPFAVGDVIGELTCLSWENHNKCYQPRMRCSCGWEGFVSRGNLLAGRSTRCGACARKKAPIKRWESKGYLEICPDAQHRDRLLDRISAIIVRCTNSESKIYPDYGGRGITVHPAWIEDRVEFLRYLVSLDGWDKPELQLDRRDNERGYAPGNLRFVTRSVNMSNKRKITAREVVEMRKHIAALEAENADLRHRYGRAEEPLHSND